MSKRSPSSLMEPENWERCSRRPPPFLIVSNSPETIGKVIAPKTLYKAPIPIPASGSVRFRLFVWHATTGHGDRRYGLEVFLSTGSGTIGNMVGLTRDDPFTATGIYNAGLCLAKAQLLNGLDFISGTYSVDTNPLVIWERTIAGNRLVSSVFEFDLNALFVPTLYVRTFVSSTASNGSYADPPAAADSHVRGWWPYSAAAIQSGTFTFDPTAITPDAFPICEDDGIEHGPLLFGNLSGSSHEYDTPNKGCYGANLQYRIRLTNTSLLLPGLVLTRVKARQTGSYYFGAGDYVGPTSGKGIPKLPQNLSDPTIGNAVDLTLGMPIQVQANSFIDTDYLIANAGGSALPAAFHLEDYLH